MTNLDKLTLALLKLELKSEYEELSMEIQVTFRVQAAKIA